MEDDLGRFETTENKIKYIYENGYATNRIAFSEPQFSIIFHNLETITGPDGLRKVLTKSGITSGYKYLTDETHRFLFVNNSSEEKFQKFLKLIQLHGFGNFSTEDNGQKVKVEKSPEAESWLIEHKGKTTVPVCMYLTGYLLGGFLGAFGLDKDKPDINSQFYEKKCGAIDNSHSCFFDFSSLLS